MAVKYHLVAKGNPGNTEAPKKFYASSVSSGKVSLKEIGKDIADISSLSYGDITNVLNNLVLQIPKYLSSGKIVKLGDLGSFRISISSEGAETEKEFRTNMIKNQKIRFFPGAELRDTLDTLKFEKE